MQEEYTLSLITITCYWIQILRSFLVKYIRTFSPYMHPYLPFCWIRTWYPLTQRVSSQTLVVPTTVSSLHDLFRNDKCLRSWMFDPPIIHDSMNRGPNSQFQACWSARTWWRAASTSRTWRGWCSSTRPPTPRRSSTDAAGRPGMPVWAVGFCGCYNSILVSQNFIRR